MLHSPSTGVPSTEYKNVLRVLIIVQFWRPKYCEYRECEWCHTEGQNTASNGSMGSTEPRVQTVPALMQTSEIPGTWSTEEY